MSIPVELFELTTPQDFDHPYEPYDIQLDLMKHLYEGIERRKMMIVESPTGTGKSLSIIVSCLSWLRDNKNRVSTIQLNSLKEKLVGELGPDEPEWVVEQVLETKEREMEGKDREIEQKLERIRAEEMKRRKIDEAKGRSRVRKKQKASHPGEGPLSEDDVERFAPADYEGVNDSSNSDGREVGDGIDPSVRKLMAQYRGKKTFSKAQDDGDEPEVLKVLYTSRTHSQLTQFVQELRKTDFATTMRVISLGSRANLCVNEDVKTEAKGSIENLNDKCLEMQKDKGKRCKFLPPVDEPGKLDDFRDHALATVHTIEDLEDLGRRTHTCPYYGSRRAIKQAHLVTLPYNMLMQKSTREALGVLVKDHTVVVDEAHNLIDTILSIHTVSITSTTLSASRKALKVYLDKFKSRLKGSNAVYLKQVVSIISSLEAFCTAWAEGHGNAKGGEEMIGTNQMLKRLGGGVDQVDMWKLDEYLRESKIAQKISGYTEFIEEQSLSRSSSTKYPQSQRQASKSNFISGMQRIHTFMFSLAAAENDGRVVVFAERVNGALAPTDKNVEAASGVVVVMKYLQLNPEESFRDIVEAARSVILAGGTMAPMSDFQEQLFSYLPSERISSFSCSHIVPKEHVMARAVGVGPSGRRLEFKFGSRGDLDSLDDLGQALSNICAVSPKGMVVFFPSYAFLDQVVARWSATGMMERLRQKKKIFTEPKVKTETEEILRDYALVNEPIAGPGGMLFAVVGAKLSEGINFSDDLARCVVVIGIPFPNLASIELKERMKYLSEIGRARDPRANDAGKALYSNLAFRAVNQCIGRAIRHRNDWSSILLLDCRYTSVAVQDKLPAWIVKSLENTSSFGSLMKDLAAFTRSRKAAQVSSF